MQTFNRNVLHPLWVETAESVAGHPIKFITVTAGQIHTDQGAPLGLAEGAPFLNEHAPENEPPTAPVARKTRRNG